MVESKGNTSWDAIRTATAHDVLNLQPINGVNNGILAHDWLDSGEEPYLQVDYSGVPPVEESTSDLGGGICINSIVNLY